MNCSTLRIGLVFMCFLALGCKKEVPDPENLDPIYKDLQSRAATSQKSLEDKVKEKTELLSAIEKLEPGSIELRNAKSDLKNANDAILEFRQTSRYYEIRSKRRMLQDRLNYKVAFSKGETWPDPNEYSEYQVITRLNEASRNWGSRVPKLSDRMDAYRRDIAGGDPKAEGGEKKAEGGKPEGESPPTAEAKSEE